MKLIITEKPSVALAISKIVGADDRCQSFYKGNDYYVSWCYGHLIELCSPDKYDSKYVKWNLEDLPIFPGEFKFQIKNDKKIKNHFSVLKNLLTSNKFDCVINACDSGREGELIFRLVYEMTKSKLPIKRLWINSMEDESIKNGMKNIKDGSLYEDLYNSALARIFADWLIGMNVSRLYSCLYKQNYSVGRVQTPTLKMIVDRYEEIISFKKQKYYTVNLKLDKFSISTSRIDDLTTAEQLRNLVGDKITITNVVKKDKVTKPELPYDLTTLQRECNKYFGFSAKETLDYAQSLYEKKLITYPRTDSRYLSEDMKSSIRKEFLSLVDNLDKTREDIVFNSKKVTDHHAIIPTASSNYFNLDSLAENEKIVYKLISDKFYSSFSLPLKEKSIKVEYIYDGYTFSTTGIDILDEGFMKHMKKYNKTFKSEILPDIKVGQEYTVVSKSINEKFTTPKAYYTEDTILHDMENAGKEYLDKDIEIERKGLGTPATRAGIIENLIFKGYIQRDKKKLIPTHKGISLVAIVADEFKSTETTAKWEMKLSNISSGKYTKKEFLIDIEKEINNLINTYKGSIN